MQPAAPSSRAATGNKPSCGVNGCQCLSRVSNLRWGYTAMIDSVPHASARVKRRLADSYCTPPQGSRGCSSHRVPVCGRVAQSGKCLHFLRSDGKFFTLLTAARLCLGRGGKYLRCVSQIPGEKFCDWYKCDKMPPPLPSDRLRKTCVSSVTRAEHGKADVDLSRQTNTLRQIRRSKGGNVHL